MNDNTFTLAIFAERPTKYLDMQLMQIIM